MKKKSEKDEYVRVCPKCGSSDIDWKIGSSTWSIALSGMGSAAIFDMFTCSNCGYASQFMPEFPKKRLGELKSLLKGGDKE